MYAPFPAGRRVAAALGEPLRQLLDSAAHEASERPSFAQLARELSTGAHLTAELAVGMITGMQGNEEGEITAKDGQPLMSGA